MTTFFEWGLGQGLAHGHVDQAGECQAGAVWLRPPGHPTPGLLEELAMLPRFVTVTGWAGMARARAVQAAMARHFPRAPHWYLAFLGVHPQAQGRGLGSLLLRHHLARIDAENAAAWLETARPRNVALYRRHGFEVVATFRPDPPYDDGGPEIYGMWRPARSASSVSSTA